MAKILIAILGVIAVAIEEMTKEDYRNGKEAITECSGTGTEQNFNHTDNRST